ncbi:MAG: tetratricopeptide repeat protein [Bacteroidetes bacterium]|nr:MAG: tetratricopeptide repeat protein [Bacteroidota bacterium]
MKYGLLLLSLGLCLACQPPNGSPTSGSGQDKLPSDSIADTPETYLQAYSLQIERNPRDYSLYEERAKVYYELDSLDQAIRDIEQALSLYRNGPELHYWRGFYAWAAKDSVRAQEEMQTAAGLGSQNPEVFYMLGQMAFFRGDYAEAEAKYQEAAKLGPEDPQYPFALGYLEESRRRHSRAATLYLQALDRDSTFAKALLQLHDLYLYQYENETEAMAYNQRLLNINPLHPLGNYNQGNYALRRALAILNQAEMPAFQEAVNEAVTHFSLTLNRDTAFAQAYYNRGYCYWLGDEARVNEAIEDFRACLRLQPDHAPAHFMLGSIYEKNGDLRTALDHYREAARLQPQSQDFQAAVTELSQKVR